jgi:hypothetical protein
MIANERKPRTTNADVMKALVDRFGTGSAASSATTSGAKTQQPNGTPASKSTQPPAQPQAQTQTQQYRVGQRVRQGDKIYRFDGSKWIEQK